MFSVYVIEGTGGSYVGVSGLDPKGRWVIHKSNARHSPKTALHYAMREHGIDAFTFTVVASARGPINAAFCEITVAEQLKRSGVHLYNVHSCGGVRSGGRALRAAHDEVRLFTTSREARR